MNSTTAGVLLAMTALILIHQHQPFIGVPLFVLGILVMNRKKK